MNPSTRWPTESNQSITETRSLVSIFVPVFNGEKYLQSTLDSLRSQTYSTFEIIIVDDGSTDRSAAIATEASRLDSRIRLIQHGVNRGLPNARNTGVRAASSTARYIMNHDSDDISHPTKLERLVSYLEANPTIAAVGSFCRYFGDAGDDRGAPALEWKPDRIRDTFHIENSMAVSATLVRTEVFTQAGLFNPQFIGCDDYDFWTRCLMQGLVLANIPEELHFIRLHPASLGSTRGATMQEEAQRIRAMYRAFRGEFQNLSRQPDAPARGLASGIDMTRLLEHVRVAVGSADIPTALSYINSALMVEPNNTMILAIERKLREISDPR
jgi:glycosyltransferase involved in cell wall biosynthesis